MLVANVPDTADMQALIDGDGAADGIFAGAHPGLVVVAMGTHEPGAMPAMAAQLASRGAAFLDAPVSGGDIGARDGTLSIMVGGDEAALERARPVFEALGRTITHVGGSGAGQVAKACNQLVVGSTIEAVAEAYVLARASGCVPGSGSSKRSRVDLPEASSSIDSAAGCWSATFAPGGRARLHAKDARIVMAAAAQAGLTLPGFAPVAAAFEDLVAQGHGELDHSALVMLLDGWDADPAT